MSGYFFMMSTTHFKMVWASGRRRVLLNSKVTPSRRTTFGIGQPSPSTRVLGGVLGHLSFSLMTPSPSSSRRPQGICTTLTFGRHRRHGDVTSLVEGNLDADTGTDIVEPGVGLRAHEIVKVTAFGAQPDPVVPESAGDEAQAGVEVARGAVVDARVLVVEVSAAAQEDVRREVLTIAEVVDQVTTQGVAVEVAATIGTGLDVVVAEHCFPAPMVGEVAAVDAHAAAAVAHFGTVFVVGEQIVTHGAQVIDVAHAAHRLGGRRRLLAARRGLGRFAAGRRGFAARCGFGRPAGIAFAARRGRFRIRGGLGATGGWRRRLSAAPGAILIRHAVVLGGRGVLLGGLIVLGVNGATQGQTADGY